MRKTFWTRLFLPLLSLFVVSILLHIKWNIDGLFINLATEVIGILITVFYVDWIIQQHEKSKWQLADEKINERLIILLNGIATRIRDGLEIDFEFLNEEKIFHPDILISHKELMRVAKDVIYSIVFQKTRTLSKDSWKDLHRETQASYVSVSTFLNVFQGRLEPNQIADLLDLQDVLSKSLIFYSVFYELAGTATDKLPKTKTDPKSLQLSGYKITADRLQDAIVLVLKLSKSVTGRK